MAVQEEHDLFDLLLFLPGKRDQAGAFGTNVRHLSQPFRRDFDDLQGVSAKLINDSFSESRPNPFD